MKVFEPITFFIILITSLILSILNYIIFGASNIKIFYFVFLVVIHLFLIIFLGYYSTLLINKYSKSKFHNRPQISYGSKSMRKYFLKHKWLLITLPNQLHGLNYYFGKVGKETKKSVKDIYKTTTCIFILSIIFIILLNKIQSKPITLFTIVFTLLIELGIEIRLKQEFVKKRF